MRNGRRDILTILGLALLGVPAPAAADPPPPAAADRSVGLTVEVAWSLPTPVPAPDPSGRAPESPVELELSEGRVVEALAWPSGPEPEKQGERVWRLGTESSGRVRARLEAPVGASMVVRAGGQTMRLPLPYVLDGPQHTPPQAPVGVSVERLPWDAIHVSGVESGGAVAPGAPVPVTLGFNVLTSEPSGVSVRCQAELRPIRGGPPVWTGEVSRVVVTNAASPTEFPLPVPAPRLEGTYVLELRANWEPFVPTDPHGNSTLLGRWFRGKARRGVSGASGGATRRVTLAVVGPKEPAPVAPAPKGARDQEADSVDLARLRGNRPTAAGRTPAAAPGRASWDVPEGALVETTRRDRLRGWISRVGSEVAQLGPADASGLAWSALGLKVSHPGRPHRLTLTVAGGHPAALGVAVVGPGGRPRLLLDACASGPPILPEGPPAAFSWLVWPDSADPILLLVNRAAGAGVQVGTVTLTELADLPEGPGVEEPAGAAVRGLGLALTGPDALDRFGAGVPNEPGLTDVLAASRNLGRYLAYCGASSVLLSDALADRARRAALGGQAAEDSTGPDRLDLAARVLGRSGVSTWLELGLDGRLPGLPAPGSPESLTRGLVRLDRRGVPDGPAPSYQTLAPEVIEALTRKVTEAVAAPKDPGRGKLAGVVVRLGRGPALPGGPDTGFDDATYSGFARDAFDAETARTLPGLAADDPGRFAARAQFLAGPGRMPWLAWRSKRVAALYAGLADAAKKAAPDGTTALTVVTPGLDDGPAGSEARRADLAGLGPSLAWRAVGLDLDLWPSGPDAPIVFRGVGLSPDDLAHDLATSPELDAKVATRPARGLWLDDDGPDPGARARSKSPAPSLTALPLDGGPSGDEPLGHALAALDARWVVLAAQAAAGNEERLRKFARVFRGLPAAPGPTAAETPPLPFGVSVRAHRAGGKTYLALANDTPYPVRLDTVTDAPASAAFDDLGRGARLKPGSDAAGRHLVLDLLPFGVAGVRVGSAGAKITAVTPYPSEAVLTTLQARYDELSARLTRLNGKPVGDHPGPPNPGFEPPAPADRAVALSVGPAPAAGPPAGWRVVGGSGAPGANTLAIDPAGPRSGRGSLRLDAPQPPASAQSDEFVPNVQSVVLVRAWLRADRPDAKARLWIEGESGGRPYRRFSDLTVAPAWAERAVRASDVPAGGLDSLRLRFEMLSAGTLWVDDVSVSGATLSDPERRNARNALVAAIQAYREKRYADFARLAGSHWARLPVAEGPTASGRSEGAAADRSSLIRTGEPPALPQGRRLR